MLLYRSFNSSNNTHTIITHTHLFSTSLPDAALTLPLLLWVLKQFSSGSGDGKYHSRMSVSAVLCQISSLHVQIHLWSFLNVCQHASTPLLAPHWSAAPCLIQYILCFFVYARSYFFVFFLTPKTSFVQLQVSISLMDHQ